jgi:hypothetical protein
LQPQQPPVSSQQKQSQGLKPNPYKVTYIGGDEYYSGDSDDDADDALESNAPSNRNSASAISSSNVASTNLNQGQTLDERAQWLAARAKAGMRISDF